MQQTVNSVNIYEHHNVEMLVAKFMCPPCGVRHMTQVYRDVGIFLLHLEIILKRPVIINRNSKS